MMAFCLEMVQHHKLDFFRVSFMIAGNTKFSVDRLLSNVAQTFTRSDVFTTQDLGNIAHQYATSSPTPCCMQKNGRAWEIPSRAKRHEYVLNNERGRWNVVRG